ncbi:phosphoenolpyruvate--protein phosphotransferase [Oscillospiraceae bacterium PP1C4]
MLTIEGIATSSGIADGRLFILENDNKAPKMVTVADTHAELDRLFTAIETAKEQLAELYQKAVVSVGEENAAIFEIHSMMLEDEDYLENIRNIIRVESICAEYAVYITGIQFGEIFSSLEDEYMRGRAADILDLSGRVVDILCGRNKTQLRDVTEKVVIAAEDLMPSQTIQLDKSKISAFVTKNGTASSHASILARSLGLPAVSALGDGFHQLRHGQFAIVDGVDGLVICEPDRILSAQYEWKRCQLEEEKIRLQTIKGTKAVTQDGLHLEICANIGHPDEASPALEEDADGVGLFRSEFLYLESSDFPSEEVQMAAYKKVLEQMRGRRVVVRTLDLGADKQAPYFHIPHEDNPALGYRAIRIELDRTEIFVTQLRALLRASVYGKLAIMFPMIVSMEEVHSIKRMIAGVKEDLRAEGISFAEEVELGIMVETPAAVMLADRLAKEVDFFSIGTNDLTQFTLAVDRMNSKISYLYDYGSPAVLRMIDFTVKQAHKNGIWVGICGESAADIELIPYYVGMGVDELSVSPSAILKVKEKVQSLNAEECRIRAEKELA